jgi:Domain of unknown function (DUF303).
MSWKRILVRARWSGLLVAATAIAAAAGAQTVRGPKPAAFPSAAVGLSSPLDYQVFQRQSSLRGSIVVRGHVAVPTDHVQVRIAGKSLLGQLPGRWNDIPFDAQTGDFSAKLLAVAGGFYEVDVKTMLGQRETSEVSVPHVGVGEVFVVSGQSNSTNYGEVRQKTQTRMVSTFSGDNWRLADDPQPGVQDGSSKGSFIPSFGDELYRKYGVPVGIASMGHGSTSVRRWLPAGEPVEVMPTKASYVVRRKDGTLLSDGTLFNGMVARMNQFGDHGFRAVLWHQGESDSHQPQGHDISAATYGRMLREVILHRESRQAGMCRGLWRRPPIIRPRTRSVLQFAQHSAACGRAELRWRALTPIRSPWPIGRTTAKACTSTMLD